jgi:hypothetical protein
VLVATLKAQLDEASAALHKLEENEEQLRQAHSAHDHESELKEQKDSLQIMGVGHNQMLTDRLETL